MVSALRHTMEVRLRSSTRLLVEAVGRQRNGGKLQRAEQFKCQTTGTWREPTELELRRLLRSLFEDDQLELRPPSSFTVCLSHLLLPFLEVEHSVGDGLRDELQLFHLGFEGAQLLQLLQLTSWEFGLFQLFNVQKSRHSAAGGLTRPNLFLVLCFQSVLHDKAD